MPGSLPGSLAGELILRANPLLKQKEMEKAAQRKRLYLLKQ